MTTAAQIKRVFAKHRISRLSQQVLSDPRPAVSIRPVEAPDDRIPIGGSKFNGHPDLPTGFKWPKWQGRPLQFLAQIDCAEARRADRARLLPEAGLLSFFYDPEQEAWGYAPEHRGSAVVHYSPSSVALKRTAPPSAFETDMPSDVCSISFKATTTFPDLDNLKIPKTDLAKYWDRLWQAFAETVKKKQGEDGSPHFRILGHPTTIQNPMEEECQFASNGIDIGGEELRASDRKKAVKLRRGAKDWILLLQLDTGAGWMWGDMGILYFWIRRQDLASRDFSGVWCILQCG